MCCASACSESGVAHAVPRVKWQELVFQIMFCSADQHNLQTSRFPKMVNDSKDRKEFSDPPFTFTVGVEVLPERFVRKIRPSI